MSAWVVSKTHIDLIVRAAEHYGRGECQGSRMQWWQVDENGEYAGWRYLEATEDDRDEYYTLSQLGQILVNENVASVHDRYPDDDVDAGELPGPIDAYYMGPYVYRDPHYVLSPGELFKALSCYEYQSCEYDGWRKSEAYAFCNSLRDAAMSRVDGYEEAPWGFDTVPGVPAVEL